MPLEHLEAHQFRNLSSLELQLDPGLQVIFGDNASGKTSIVEAIYTLCSGKSFLGASPRKMTQFGKSAFSLQGHVSQPQLAKQLLQYHWQDQHISLKVGADKARRTSEYAAIQPVQVVSPYSYRLIEDTPDLRRRYLDWGVFHVKHSYSSTWRQFQRVLVQRNAMLVAGTDTHSLAAWDHEYIELAQRLNLDRQNYIAELHSFIAVLLEKLFPQDVITLDYHPGWDQEKSLSRQLEESFNKDQERKFTYYGPQRADLVIKINKTVARDTASRGQKKLLTFALFLAQAQLQQRAGDRKGLLLVDDLPSELDAGHQAAIFEILESLQMQIIISCIDFPQLNIPEGQIKKRFHVKQGQASEVV